MRAIVVGYGYMGEIRRRIIEDLPQMKLAGVCDQHLTSETSLGCNWFTDFREAIRETEPDIVFVCTPNRFSPEVCIYALENGSHVFCEKPPGRDLADVQRIMVAERAHPELKVMFGFNHRFHPAIIEAKSIVDGGRMGRILWMRGVYGKSGGKDFDSSWRNDPSISGGGILIDQGIHMLDLFRFFCGDFDEVQGILSTGYWDVDVEDNAFVTLRSTAGQSVQLHSSATLWKHTFSLHIGMENGYLIAQGLLSKSGSYGREALTIGRRSAVGEEAAVGNPREEIVHFDRDMSWQFQVEDLMKCIDAGVPVTDSSTEDALRVMEIIDKVYRQAGVAKKADLESGSVA